jgi:hypothetical protein
MFGLEAIVMKENRPVVFVRGNSYDDVGESWTSLNAAEVKTRLSELLPVAILTPLSSTSIRERSWRSFSPVNI